VTASRAPRFLIIYDLSFPFVLGGGQRRLWEVGRRMAAGGWAVEWLTFKAWDGGNRTERDGISYFSLGPMPQLYNKAGKRNKYEPVLFFLRLLPKLGHVRRFDAIWVAQWPMLHILPLLIACKIFRVKLVVDWWEVWPLSVWKRYSSSIGPLGYHIQNLYLRLIGRNAHIVTDTALEQGRILALTDRPQDITVIPNGVPLDEIGHVDVEAPSAYDLGCLVRLKDHKRVDLILDAVHALRENHGLLVTAAIVGDGPERQNLEAQAARLGITEQVTFFGFMQKATDAYAILKQAKVCLVTTVGGGAGSLAVLEGYGCGLPVFSFRVEEGIAPDLIDEGRTGYLVPEISGAALAASIHGVLSQPGRVTEMKKSARAKGESMSWDNIAAAYRTLFDRLTDQP
jgi:glycosyltransferase involved in cell wall biosynthesis